jgi:hypothetical protein
MNKFSVKRYVNQIVRDLDRVQEERLTKAAVFLRTGLKNEVGKKIGTWPHVSRPGEAPFKQSGDLQEGITFTREPGKRFVGFTRPASHAHLLEFGTGPRTVKNYEGKPGVTKDVGPMAARPFFLPTFDREEETLKNILGGEWL